MKKTERREKDNFIEVALRLMSKMDVAFFETIPTTVLEGLSEDVGYSCAVVLPDKETYQRIARCLPTPSRSLPSSTSSSSSSSSLSSAMSSTSTPSMPTSSVPLPSSPTLLDRPSQADTKNAAVVTHEKHKLLLTHAGHDMDAVRKVGDLNPDGVIVVLALGVSLSENILLGELVFPQEVRVLDKKGGVAPSDEENEPESSTKGQWFRSRVQALSPGFEERWVCQTRDIDMRNAAFEILSYTRDTGQQLHDKCSVLALPPSKREKIQVMRDSKRNELLEDNISVLTTVDRTLLQTCMGAQQNWILCISIVDHYSVPDDVRLGWKSLAAPTRFALDTALRYFFGYWAKTSGTIVKTYWFRSSWWC